MLMYELVLKEKQSEVLTTASIFLQNRFKNKYLAFRILQTTHVLLQTFRQFTH